MIVARPFADSEALLAALERECRAALDQIEGPHALMLAGGGTPRPLYQRLAANADAAPDDAWLLFSDDRLVPPDSPDSNYGGARHLIDALRVPDHRIIRVRPELGLDGAARRYDEEIADFFAAGGRIVYGLIGLGEDGHTCSLFDRETAAVRDRFAIAAPGRAGFDRVSVTAAVLNRVEALHFLVTGSPKASVIRRLLATPEELPAGIAVADHPNVILDTDLDLG